MTKRCSVACDTSAGVVLCELELPEEATVEQALQAARLQLGDSLVEWQTVAVGIHGQRCERSVRPAHGDRVEVYRPLPLDPRAARRARIRRRLT